MIDKQAQKIALVTGANKGIGYEIARQLGVHGATVLVGARDPQKGQEAAIKMQESEINAHTIKLDVDDQTSINRAAKFITEQYGRLDILVNNAGIVGADGYRNPSETTIGAMRAVFETNVYGPVRVIEYDAVTLKTGTRCTDRQPLQ